jgi:hypothetical protein
MRRNVGMVVHVLKYGHERWEEMATQIARAMAVQLTEDNLDEEDVEKILEMFGVEVEDDGQ